MVMMLLYVNTCVGLVKFAEELGLTLLVPRRKITVLLIGNHSAGKSSFINWYVCLHTHTNTHTHRMGKIQ